MLSFAETRVEVLVKMLSIESCNCCEVVDNCLYSCLKTKLYPGFRFMNIYELGSGKSYLDPHPDPMVSSSVTLYS